MSDTEQERKAPFKVRVLALLLCSIIRTLYATLRLTIRREVDLEALCRQHGGLIVVTWHGGCFIPIARCRGKGYVGLISLSRDGQLLDECLRRLRWRTIRGSTGRAAVRAMKAALGVILKQETVLAVAPDGPRGPARKVKPGAVFLAQKSGRPILPVGIGMRRCWRAKSWDRFRIPQPFSHVSLLFGDPIFVAPEDDIEATCHRLEEMINALEEEAMTVFSLKGERGHYKCLVEAGESKASD